MNFEALNCITWFNEHWYEFNFDLLSKEEKIKYNLQDKTGIDYLKSSTTILGSAPKEWLAKYRGQVGNWEADRIMSEAQTKGSNIHSAINASFNNVTVFYNDAKRPKYSKEEIEKLSEGKGYYVLTSQQEALEFYRFVQIFNLLKPTHIASEFNLYNLQYMYAGTGDLLWEMKEGEVVNGRNKIVFENGIYLFDVKTGKEDDKNYPKQLASYCEALRLHNNIEVKGAGLIYTNAETKTGIEGTKIVLYTPEELKYHFEQFLHVLAISNEYSTEKPKVIDLPTIFKAVI